MTVYCKPYFKDSSGLVSHLSVILVYQSFYAFLITVFAARCYASAAYAVMWCLCVCRSVGLSRWWILSK